MKSELLEKIDEANHRGYAVKIKNELGQKRITCISQRDNTSRSSVVPQDHFDDDTVIDIIEFNITKHREDELNK